MSSKIQENEEEEVNFEHVSHGEDNEFDLVITALEELLMDEHFQEMQNRFCERHCDMFEESKENKLEYTSVFQEYTNLVENTILSRLAEKVPGMNLMRLERLLESRKDELSGEIFDLIISLGDFLEFKDLMLSYKRSKASTAAAPAPTTSSGKSKGRAPVGDLDLCITGKKY